MRNVKQLFGALIALTVLAIAVATPALAAYPDPGLGLSESEKAWLVAHPKIRVHNEVNRPPINFSVDGKPQGYSIDYMNLLAAKIGVEVDYVTGPKWAEFIGMLRDGQIDVILNFVKTPERDQLFAFTEPYMVQRRVIVSRVDESFSSLESLTGKRVAYFKGHDMEARLKRQPGINLVVCKDFPDCLSMVGSGQADATIGGLGLTEYSIRHQGIVGLHMTDNPMDIDLLSAWSMATRKDQSILRDILNKALKLVKPEEDVEIQKRWFPTEERPSGLMIKLTGDENAWLLSHPVIRVSNESDYPPYDFAIDGQPQGYSIDLLNLLAKRIGFKVDYVNGPTWQELQQLQKQGKLDLLQMVIRTPQREEYGIFSEPYFRLKQVFVTRKGEADIIDFDQLQGKTVAVGKDWAQEDFLATHYPGIKRIAVNSLERMLELVSSGEADATVEAEGPVEYWLSRKGLTDLKISGWAKEFDKGKPQSFHFFALKDAPQLVSMLNKALASLTPNELRDIQSKWLGSAVGKTAAAINPIVLTPAQQDYLRRKGGIKMCSSPDIAPFAQITKDGVHQGIAADVIGALSEIIGTKVSLVPTRTWTETLEFAKARQCDMISFAVPSLERKQFLDFTRPYLSFPIVIVTLNNQPFIPDDLHPFLNETFGVIKGASSTEFLRARYPSIHLVEFNDAREGLKQVLDGKLFAFVSALPVVGHEIQAQGLVGLKVAGQLPESFEMSIATRNDEPVLGGIFQAAIDALSLDQRQEILNRWLAVRYEQKFDYALIWKVGSGLVVLFAAILLWNRRLAKLNKVLDLAHMRIARQNAELAIAAAAFNSQEGMIVTDPAGVILRVNQALVEITGYPPEEAIGHTPKLFKSGRQNGDFYRAMWSAVKGTGTWQGEIWNRRKNGCEYLAWLTISAVNNDEGIVTNYVGSQFDITERKRAEEQIIRLSNLYAALSQSNQAIVHCADEEELLPQICRCVVEYGFAKMAWIGLVDFESKRINPVASYGDDTRYVDSLNVIVDDADPSARGLSGTAIRDDKPIWCQDFLLDPATALWHTAARKAGVRSSAFLPLHRDGIPIGCFAIYSSTVNAFDDEAQKLLLEMAADISFALDNFSREAKRKEAVERINELAFYDQLTGLPNRRLLADRMNQSLAASIRNKREGALFFIDLDHFKTVNDTQGHDKGDLLLQEVGQRLSTNFREVDTVARIGGDEFVVLLDDLSDDPEIAATQAEVVGEKILEVLAEPYLIAGAEFSCTASIGVTLFGGKHGKIDELKRQADIAMYQAKSAGRNALCFFDPGLQASIKARAALEDDLRKAIKRNEFVLHYQPQVDRLSLVGAEALIRWNHPERGMVFPDAFISMAEESGMILPIGHWVLETACAQIVAWAGQPEMRHITLAVNVSARQFRQKDFVERVSEVLDQTGADPRRLKLELTESMLVDNVEDVIAKMTALKSRGLSFSLDDFGTGYSSLSYLKRLPLEQLKIDQSFVRDVLTDSQDAAIAKTIVALAESLGIGVMAEGVEIAEQRDFLANLGCHAYQGYFFSKPLPLEDFERIARQAVLLVN